MGATFVGVSLRRKTVSWSWCLAAVVVFGCSVFPDEATLPSAMAGAGGSSVLPPGGAGAEGGAPAPLGGAGRAEGGALTTAGAGAGTPPVGMAGTDAGGAGGAPCEPQPPLSIAVTADTWIESAKPTTGHGNDDPLSVIGGGQERRALFAVTLPAAGTSAVLLKATFVLQLVANADTGSARRQLRLFQLEHPVLEGRATWNKWDNGASGNWTRSGGDFGAAIAEAEVPAGTSTGTLAFDVTTFVRSTLATGPVPLSLILIETSTPPPPPAELAFKARGGDASEAPRLILESCLP